MEAAAIITLALVAVGAILYVHHRLYYGRAAEADTHPAALSDVSDESEECCGMHVVCEKDSLLAAVSEDIVYYDDEELDVYTGRRADEYDRGEIEQFRDVLLTLRPEDIAGWARSIQLRGITLPAEVREELLLIVSEARNNV